VSPSLLQVLLLILALTGLILISWFALGKLIKVLIEKEIVDRPNERTLHKGIIPRGGGLIIVAALIIALILAATLSKNTLFYTVLTGIALAWASLSWLDDKYDLSPKLRLLIQVAIAGLTVAAFGWVEQLLSFKLGWFGPVVSLLGLVWMANLYNFMDGMDGLAGSQSVIAALTLSFWFYISGDSTLACICLVIAASSYGFVLRNWSPAQVFMGDVGSITLGAVFGSLIIIGVSRYGISVLSFVSLFAVFIVDATVTIMLRASRGEKIWLPHRQHFYQRLANAGYDHSSIVIAAVCLMIICSLLATLSVAYHGIILLCGITTLVLLIGAIGVVIALEKKAANNLNKH